MQEVVQTVMGTLGAVGISVLFNVRGRKLAAAGAGAALSWMVYLILYRIYGDKVISLFGATLTAAVLSEILARVMKAPVIILLVPMLIPLLPGSDLYYTTTYMVRGNTAEFTAYLGLVMREAGAIAFGIILVTCAVQVILKIYRHFRYL
ncbi:MAG: threonine/serine exporter family protein [Lachnospiraceae bacterium]|nr:threonine/serine exporter family protein [Lachnospiraceae bacterium]